MAKSMNRRIAAIVGSIVVGFQGVFLTDYNLPNHNMDDPEDRREPHVFSFIQQQYRSGQLKKYLLGIHKKDDDSSSDSEKKE